MYKTEGAWASGQPHKGRATLGHPPLHFYQNETRTYGLFTASRDLCHSTLACTLTKYIFDFHSDLETQV